MNTHDAHAMMNAIMAASLVGFMVGVAITYCVMDRRRPRHAPPGFPWDDDIGDDGMGSWEGEAAEMRDLHGPDLRDALSVLRSIQEEEDRPKQYVVHPLDE